MGQSFSKMYSNSLIEIYVIYHNDIPDMDLRFGVHLQMGQSFSKMYSNSLIEIYVIYHNNIPDMDPGFGSTPTDGAV